LTSTESRSRLSATTEEADVNNEKKLMRQGDVFFILTPEAVPDAETEAVPPDPRGLVLAEGETSGHHHGVFGGAKLFRFRDGRSDRLLRVEETCEVRVVGGGSGGVDRHTPISLTPGNYLIRTQRAWDSTRARNVAD